MDTEKRYETDGHLAEFDAVVTECQTHSDSFCIALDRTAFFPEGGGQYGDRGVLSTTDGQTVSISDTQEQDGVVLHISDAPLPPGTPVHGALDWPLRFARMQCHSGEHIVSGLFHSLYGLDNVGFHLSDEEMTIDLSGAVTWADLERVERLANEAVAKDLPVQISFPTPEELSGLAYRSKLELSGHVRIITIPGYDVCACCAPHVARTGEIGLIHFLSMQNWKGGVRIRMLCGSRAVEDVMAKQRAVGEISNLLSAKQTQVFSAVERLHSELEAARAQTTALGRRLARAILDAQPEHKGTVLLFEELDAAALRELVNGSLARGAALCAAYSGSDRAGYRYIMGSGGADLRPLVKEMNAGLNGRGGGSAQMVQGSLNAREKDIRAWWAGRSEPEKH